MTDSADLLSEIFSETIKQLSYKQTGNVLYADPWKEGKDKKEEPRTNRLILRGVEQKFEDIERFIHFYHDVHKSHGDGPDNRIVFMQVVQNQPKESIEAEFGLKEDVTGTVYYVKTTTPSADHRTALEYLKRRKVKIAKVSQTPVPAAEVPAPAAAGEGAAADEGGESPAGAGSQTTRRTSGPPGGEGIVGYVCLVYTSYDAWTSLAKTAEMENLALQDFS